MLKHFQDLTWKVVNLVNSAAKNQRVTRNALTSRVILKEFIEVASRMDQKGFFAGTLGEISLRITGGKFLITPADKPLCLLTEEALCLAPIEKISSEVDKKFPKHLHWHQCIYKKTSAKAVVVCQPVYAMLLANCLQKPKSDLLQQANRLVDLVEIMPEKEVDGNSAWKEEGIFFVPSVGMLLWGDSFSSLVDRIEIIERISLLSVIGN